MRIMDKIMETFSKHTVFQSYTPHLDESKNPQNIP